MAASYPGANAYRMSGGFDGRPRRAGIACHECEASSSRRQLGFVVRFRPTGRSNQHGRLATKTLRGLQDSDHAMPLLRDQVSGGAVSQSMSFPRSSLQRGGTSHPAMCESSRRKWADAYAGEVEVFSNGRNVVCQGKA